MPSLGNSRTVHSSAETPGMFPLPSPSIYQSSTCRVTYGSMGHVDRRQPPQSSKPWSAIAAQDFIHKIDLIIPQECYAVVHQKLVEQRRQPAYARVTLALGQLLEVAFFTECIKNGDILMLSEGSASTDNTFALHRGILNMYLDRETFERAGLAGKPYGAKGNRGAKPRWIVSYDLTSPSMMHGKRGFDRLLRACRNVFGAPLTWLFCHADAAPNFDGLEKFKPDAHTAAPTTMQKREVPRVMMGVPGSIVAEGDRSALEESATDLYEWLSLIRLQSPRIAADDKIDPFLSRYRAPPGEGGQAEVCMLSWQGFIAASWFRGLVVDALAACPPQQWISISATGFSRTVAGNPNDLTLLRPSGAAGEYLMWETRGFD